MYGNPNRSNDKSPADLPRLKAEALRFFEAEARYNPGPADFIIEDIKARKIVDKQMQDPAARQKMLDAVRTVARGLTVMVEVAMEGRGYDKEPNPFIRTQRAIDLMHSMWPAFQDTFTRDALTPIIKEIFDEWGASSEVAFRDELDRGFQPPSMN